MRCTCAFTLAKAIEKSSLETVSESIVVSLKDNADVFSPVCGPKIRIVKNIGTGEVDICLVSNWFSIYR